MDVHVPVGACAPETAFACYPLHFASVLRSSMHTGLDLCVSEHSLMPLERRQGSGNF
jgi:hypothetical protein